MKTIAALFLVAMLFGACSNDNKPQHSEHAHAPEETSAQKYTCPMHPNVVQDSPGACPVCGMDLVPVNSAQGGETNDLMLTDSQIRLANITTQKISQQPVGQTVVANGRLVENQELSEVVSSRVPGRVEVLFVREPGRTIQKGEPMFTLYSEQLLTLQREYLLARDQYESLGSGNGRYQSFVEAAKRKLLLYGLTEAQIEKLAQSKAPGHTITFLAPVTGVVTEIPVAEGQYVAEGAVLLKIERIDQLWLEAELYPGEASLVRTGDRINVLVAGFENDPVEAVIDFLSPEYSAGSQITILRATVPNPTLKYTPGMQAQVLFTHSSKKALSLPVDAVIRDGNGAHVYVQKGINTFRPVMVKTGIEDVAHVEITEGLREGDTVAVTGAYLLYSEIILKKGTDPMAGHSH